MVISPERGGIRAPVLVVVVAAAIVGGTLVLMSDKDPGKANSDGQPRTGVVAAAAPVIEPVIEEEVLKIEGEDGEEIVKGELIPFRNEFGEKQYRLREAITGTTGDGRPLRWTATLRVNPAKMEKVSMNRDRMVSKKRAKTPPKLQVRDGRTYQLNKDEDK